METNKPNSDSFDENQSLQVIKEMIQVSHKKMKNDGILFILWGWISFITYLSEYLLGSIVHTYQMSIIKGFITTALAILGLIFTIVYIYRQSRKATTYIGISLRYVWASLFIGLVLINLIQFNVLHKIIFELQHPIFMVLIAFSIVVTGGILRYKMIIAGGIVFGLLAFICSYLSLHEQLLVDAIAWLIAFIIPGHILYSTRKS
jgi:hypothetical protein